MKNKLLMLGLLSLLVGCGGSNASSNKVSSSMVSTPIVSTPKESSTSSSVIDPSVNNSSSKISITPSNPTLNVVDDIKIRINERVNYLTLVSAYDTIDGNISHLISVELPSGVSMENGDLVFSKVGNYEIKFEVTNSSNLTSTGSINIEVYEISGEDKNAPVILAYKDIRVKPGVMAYPLEGVTALDDFDGNISSSLVATYQQVGDATNGISFNEEGNYTITISSTDQAGNIATQEINIEVNSEDVPTYVDMTENILIEYNCTITTTSEIVPYEGTISKEVTLKVKETQVYANFRLTFDEAIDLENKKLSMYVKAGDNVKNDRLSIDMRQGADGVSQKQIELREHTGTGYSVVDKGNGWFLLTIVFAQVWTPTTYVTDYLRLVFSNADITTTAKMYVADVYLDDYKGEDIGGGESGSDNDDVIEPTQDFTDLMEVNYNCVVELDGSVSHDGVQAAKVKAFDEWIATKNYVEKDLAGYQISFYVKFEEGTVRKNRIYAQFKDNADVAIVSDIAISTQDPLIDGVTLSEPDENGWSKVTIDCDAVGVGGVATRKFIIKYQCADATALNGVAWIDELYFTKKGAQ